MRNMIFAGKLNTSSNKQINNFVSLNRGSGDLSENTSVSEILSSEGCECFSNYIKELGLANDPYLVVLSSLHHYYYDAEEMKNVKTLISMKLLNQEKEIKSFLHSIFTILSKNSNYIGCFIDNSRNNGYELRNNSLLSQNKSGSAYLENGIVSQIPFINMIYSFIDLKTNKFISANSVSTLLEDHGFKVLSMKELNGITYFHSKKVGSGDYSIH
jgi:hypothetical protein